MIPPNISRDHIIQAIHEVEREGIPVRRLSRKYQVLYNGAAYPPKYLISRANYYANGEEHPPESFGGGGESNGYLRNWGFTVVDMSGQVPRPEIRMTSPNEDAQEGPHDKPRGKSQNVLKTGRKTRHTERCPACKAAVEKMLAKIYGDVIREYGIRVETNPEHFSETQHAECLRAIHATLAGFRGHDGFAKAKSLNVDYFVPSENLIVEFDESQHFTEARKIALEQYPDSLDAGFSRSRWRGLCLSLDKHDNDPPYRDEQRAWYDAMRDFYPSENGLKPIVRLYAGEMRWCSLDPENPADVEFFKRRYIEQSETSDIYSLIEQFNAELNSLKYCYYDWAKGSIDNDGIGSDYNKATGDFMKKPTHEKRSLAILLRQIIIEIRGIQDPFERYEIIREMYCTHPSLHELWFFDDHFRNFFTAKSGGMKQRSGLHSVLTSLERGTFTMTRRKQVSTSLIKQTILLENMFCGRMSHSLRDAVVLSEEEMAAEIRALSGIGSPSPEDIVDAIPSVLDITRTILELSNFHPLSTLTPLTEGSFLFYAPCAINEGPLFTKKSDLKGTEIVRKITDFRQESIRECLLEYYDIIPVRKD